MILLMGLLLWPVGVQAQDDGDQTFGDQFIVLDLPSQELVKVDVHPDGQRIAATVWELDDGFNMLAQFIVVFDIRDVTYNDDGLASPEPVYTQAVPVDSSMDVKFSPDGTLIAIRVDMTITVLEVATFEPVTTFTVERGPDDFNATNALLWSADDRYIGVASFGLLVAYDLTTDEQTSRSYRDLEGTFYTLSAHGAGWLVYNAGSGRWMTQPILSCSFMLDACESFVVPVEPGYRLLSATPDGDVIYGSRPIDDGAAEGFVALRREADGVSYRVDEARSDLVTDMIWTLQSRIPRVTGGQAEFLSAFLDFDSGRVVEVYDRETLTLESVWPYVPAYSPDSTTVFTLSYEQNETFLTLSRYPANRAWEPPVAQLQLRETAGFDVESRIVIDKVYIHTVTETH